MRARNLAHQTRPRYHATTTTDRVGGGIGAPRRKPAIPWRPRNRERASGREEPDDAELLPDRDSTPAALSPRPPTGRLPGRGLSAARLRPIVRRRSATLRRRQNIFAFSEIGAGGENIQPQCARLGSPSSDYERVDEDYS